MMLDSPRYSSWSLIPSVSPQSMGAKSQERKKPSRSRTADRQIPRLGVAQLNGKVPATVPSDMHYFLPSDVVSRWHGQEKGNLSCRKGCNSLVLDTILGLESLKMAKPSGAKVSTARAVNHWIIAANLGDDDSIEILKTVHEKGVLKKDCLAAALRAHKSAVDATKSLQRNEANQFYFYFCRMNRG
eukprot:scaffold919_cov96-Skeletonema_dohrnii-CCMP3373.AAC.4